MAVNHEVFLGTKFTCETCGKVYWTKSEFHRHVRSHTDEASYVWLVIMPAGLWEKSSSF